MPTHLHVVKSVSKEVGEASLEAVAQFRFKPATACGMPVPAQQTIMMTFHN